jgi:hypothetical protein
MLMEVWLVVFDLQDIIGIFLDDGAGNFLLEMTT